MATLKTALIAEGSPNPPLPKQRAAWCYAHHQFRHVELGHEASTEVSTGDASTGDAPPLAASTTSLCSALGSDVEAAGDGDMLGARR